MKKILVMIALVLTTASAQAAYPGKMTISGKIMSFDSKLVKIDTGGGIVSVPRTTVIQNKKLAPSQLAVARVSWVEILTANKNAK
jgi:hypothetical protein